jgi:hypothetical protein
LEVTKEKVKGNTQTLELRLRADDLPQTPEEQYLVEGCFWCCRFWELGRVENVDVQRGMVDTSAFIVVVQMREHGYERTTGY